MRLSRFRRLISRTYFYPDIPPSNIHGAKLEFLPPCDRPREPYSPQGLTYWSPLRKLRDNVYDFEPLYPKTVTKQVSKFPKKGLVFDATSVLSLFPTYISSSVCQSKYLMVCSFKVPVLRGHQKGIPDLVSVCSELRDVYGSNFEMILVAKMRHRWFNDKAAFNHFFSAFPSFCHVVPFSKTITHHLIRKQLCLDSSVPMFVLLERFVQPSSFYKVLQHWDISFISEYGANWFPYDDENLQDKQHQLVCSTWSSFPSKLDHILARKCSELQVFNFLAFSGGYGNGTVLLSELQGKVVGLYLCYDGSLARKLDKVCGQCRERGLELEIVIIYMPFHFYVSSTPDKFIKFMNEELYNLENSKFWWILPFTDSLSRRLLKICPDKDDWGYNSDGLIIIGPHGEYSDPHAGVILDMYGIDLYPFTRERLIEWELEKIRSLTLESLLNYEDRDYVLGKGSDGGKIRVPVTQLRGRVILFQFDFKGKELLLKYYAQIKKAHPSFDVVSVMSTCSEMDTDLPWLVCPFNRDHSAIVDGILRCPALIAFGEDGRVSSYVAVDLLVSKGIDAFPFQADLRQDVMTQWNRIHSDLLIFNYFGLYVYR